jgi:acetylglutamate kinase
MTTFPANISNLIQNSSLLKSFKDKTVVIKYGGSVMENQNAKVRFCEQVVALKNAGVNIMLVHGGGKEISAWLKKVNIEPKFHNGRRITDAATMELAEMVLCGKTRNDLVSTINMLGGKALGLCGKDASIFKADFLDAEKSLGFVGKVTETDVLTLNSFIKIGIPVISPIGLSPNGDTLNINADEAAGKIASDLKAARFILLTDVDGILKDGAVIRTLSLSQAKDLLKDPAITGGMIPKLSCCIEAVESGVDKVSIISGISEYSLISDLTSEEGSGTSIYQ